MLVLLLFLAVNAKLTSAECDCGNNSKVIEFVGLTERFFPPADNATGAPCLKNCSYFVSLTGQALDPEWRGLTITTSGFNPGTAGGQLFYYDGMNNTESMLNLTTATPLDVTPPTTSSSARVDLFQSNDSDATAASFILGFQPAKATPTTPTPPTTSEPTTGEPSADWFSCDARRLQFELSVVVDCSNLTDEKDFEEMRIFVGTTLPEWMTIITDNRSENSTRITLARAVPYTSTTASPIGNMFPPWSKNFADFNELVNVSVRQNLTSRNYSAFANTLEQLKLLAYNNPTYYPIRPHAMKLAVIITGTDVDSGEAGDAGDANGRLQKIINDMHKENILTLAIVVGAQNSTLLDYGPWQWRVYEDRNDLNSNDSFTELMDNLLCDGNKMCKQDDCGQAYNLSSAGNDTQFVQTNNFDKSNETAPSRYCNNMDCEYTFYNEDGNTSHIEITVGYYDLETDYDFLNVSDVDTGTLRASFTGNGVSNSRVCVGGSAALVRLITDVEQVYGGFNCTARLVPALNCPIPDKAHVEVNGRVASD